MSIGPVDSSCSPVLEELEVKEKLETPSVKETFKKMVQEGGDKSKWISLLETLYGKSLVSRALNSRIANHLPDTLGKKECLELLAAIGHAVTLEDFSNFFAAVKRSDTSFAILNHLQLSYHRLWWVENFTDLPTSCIHPFIDLFRNPIQLIDPEAKLSLGEELKALRVGGNYTTYTRSFNTMKKKGDRRRPEFSFAPRELLAKKVAYADPLSIVDGMIVPILNEEKSCTFYYQVKGQIHSKGVHAYVLTPINNDPNLPVQLIFRGTDDVTSINRDLDPTGVGKRAFDANSKAIMKILSGCRQTKLEVTGHSLGASDAQRAMVILADPLNKKQFKEIHLFAYCTPKLDTPTVKQWEVHLETLKNQKSRPTIHLNFAGHENDLVTLMGDTNLSKVNSPFVHTNYLIVSSTSGIHKVDIHHTIPFFKGGNFDFETDGRTFTFLKSTTPDEIAKEIQKLETLEKTNKWVLTLKGYFFRQETKEEIEKKIADLKDKHEKLEQFEKEKSEQSWMVWTATKAASYTVQPLIYHAMKGFRRLTNQKEKSQSTTQTS